MVELLEDREEAEMEEMKDDESCVGESDTGGVGGEAVFSAFSSRLFPLRRFIGASARFADVVRIKLSTI